MNTFFEFTQFYVAQREPPDCLAPHSTWREHEELVTPESGMMTDTYNLNTQKLTKRIAGMSELAWATSETVSKQERRGVGTEQVSKVMRQP